jgi:NAD(P)-dependent dehydrogenase (short-subunit alcohol dehydrogenase family)
VDQFAGRVAVITGAASGIGLALAERAAREGMSVVMADIETGALDAAADRVRSLGARVAAQRVDVSNEADVDSLARRAYEEFGAVHLLCNNAGVLHRERAAWEFSLADWKWVFDVNVWGVVHGIQSFVPRMLASGEPGHIVNTASMAGLITGGMGTAVYDASKHAVLSLSESLYRDLVVRQSRVSASVLCPGAVDTNIFTAERNRPTSIGAAEGEPPQSRGAAGAGDMLKPEQMADSVFEAVRENRFYVLAAQTVIYEWTKMGHDRMWEGRSPAVPRRLIAERDATEPGQR